MLPGTGRLASHFRRFVAFCSFEVTPLTALPVYAPPGVFYNMELMAKDGSLMDDSGKTGGPDEAEDAQAQKKLRRRLASMAVFMVLLAIPVAIGLWRMWDMHSDLKAAEAAAVAELAKPQPLPGAYGVLGSVRLDQGRLDEALPLLQKAAAFELQRGQDTRDSLTYAKAHIVGAKKGVAGANLEAADAALRQALQIADKLAKGKRAATYFSAGIFWRDLGKKAEAVKALETACALQPDDWVEGPAGQRYKSSGISSYYQKMLAGAKMD